MALLTVIFVLLRCLLYLDTAICFYLIIVSLGLIYIGLKDKIYSSLTITGIVTIIILISYNKIHKKNTKSK